MPDPRHALGDAAENATVLWLTGQGWTVLARRCRPGAGGELDLVAVDRTGTLVGIEVRARRTSRAGSAAASVDARQISRLRLALAAYAAASGGRHRGLRLDLVTAEPAAAGPGERPRWRLARLPGIG